MGNPLLRRPANGRARDYSKGVDMAARPGARHPNYRDLRERAKRRQQWREENLRRIVELHHERHLHSLRKPGTADGTGDIPMAA
jgi:hypothetical protein